MTKTIFHVRPMPRPLARSLSIGAMLVVVLLSVGGALAQRMEHRAEQDRLSFGEVGEQR